jgi:PAS domain S-box-containing protein
MAGHLHEPPALVKGQDCLYGILSLIEMPDLSLEEMLREILDLLPRSFRYPCLACMRIALKDQAYETANFQSSPWRMVSDIKVQGELTGTVEAYYLKDPCPDGQEPFLPEEVKLIDAVAELLGRIIDRKRAEKARLESDNKFRTIAENIPQKIFIKDRDSRYVSVNENYARDLGIRPEEVQGKSDYDFFPKELAEKYRADDQRIMRTNGTEHIEEKYIQEEREIWIHTVKAPVRDEKGEITGVVGIFMDISDRKRAEEALTAESLRLAETNTALRVLLERREEDQQEMERKILTNVKTLVLPHLERLRSLRLSEVQESCLDMAVANLRQVTAPFLRNLAVRFTDFTPREIQVANLVRKGKTSKEIASLFNISVRSVEFHRDRIRKKLGLNQKNCNLRVFLMNLSE